jgi:hypothetical protein
MLLLASDPGTGAARGVPAPTIIRPTATEVIHGRTAVNGPPLCLEQHLRRHGQRQPLNNGRRRLMPSKPFRPPVFAAGITALALAMARKRAPGTPVTVITHATEGDSGPSSRSVPVTPQGLGLFLPGQRAADGDCTRHGAHSVT